ncbi:MAG: glutamate--tRNA ligase [Tenericutes bacterium HGW-Tenericutes-3]|nr:MAG: glutamate--tRNA ligase [Tenericutes bacterium HGW-Tenericutes-3]
MTKLELLANLIYPNLRETLDDLEKKYPKRNLGEQAMVTRFAPSPTGFLHTGSLFASLISWRLAKQTNGVFFCRLEDTDTKREIAGTGDLVLNELSIFGINPDESFIAGGAYGPYRQSERKELYDTIIKELIIRGRAYPCFCSHDTLNQMREYQESIKVNPGYYGEYATCRKLSVDEMIEKVKNGESFVMRFKSMGHHDNKITIHDEIRGTLELTQNDQDIVIMKGDGLPTYHFAHLVDDHFMRTTHITRGEEWMPSLPIHIELFEAMDWVKPYYAHLPVIMKLEDGRKRKLSKRKDPEAAVSFFLEAGYPIEGIMEYLMTIANSNFEEWRLNNLTANIFDFNLSFDKMTLDGALFDLEKVQSISKERLGAMSSDEIGQKALAWAIKYQPDFAKAINQDFDYFKAILSIERGGEKPRKDYTRYSDIFTIIDFMYDEYFDKALNVELPFNPIFTKEQKIIVLEKFLSNPALDLDEESWFNNLKQLGNEIGFAPNAKEYKKNKEAFLGHIGDFAEIIRISISGRKNTPNFYHVLRILGLERIKNRIIKTVKTF